MLVSSEQAKILVICLLFALVSPTCGGNVKQN